MRSRFSYFFLVIFLAFSCKVQNQKKEDVFLQFEDVAIPLITKHRGELVLRLRPNAESVVANAIEVPYEVHLVRFENGSGGAETLKVIKQ